MPLDHTKHPCYKLALEYGFKYDEEDCFRDSAHGFNRVKKDWSLTLHSRNGWTVIQIKLGPSGEIEGLNLNTRVEGYGVKSLRTHLASLQVEKPYPTREEIMAVLGLEGSV